MAKVDTDAQAVAVQALLGGLSLKRKQELIDRHDRLRMQFMHTQKMAAAKAREPQINAFLANVVASDRKVRELVFNAWVKDNAQTLGEVPEFPERFKREGEAPADEEGLEPDIKEATATVKKWIKSTDVELVQTYLRMGPYEFPSKVLTAAKKPKAKEAPAATAEEATAEAPAAAGPVVSEAALDTLRAEFEAERAKYESRLAKQEEDLTKFKRLLEENKDKRKSELAEAQDKSRAELSSKQAEWSRTESQLRKEIAELQRGQREASEKTSKARDEIFPLRQQLEKAEKEARRAQTRVQEATEAQEAAEGELTKLQDRIKVLESAQQQLVTLEKQLQKYQKKGAAVALASTDNLKIWEEALQEQELKEAFRRTLKLDNVKVSTYEYDEKDLHDIWKQLIAQEQDLVDRFFALDFNELYQPSEEFRDLITSFIDIKDSLVAREQLALMLNFVGNRFLSTFKQKV